MVKKNKWMPLQHKILKSLKSYPILQGKTWMLLCSGGKDSVSLLFALKDLAPAMNSTIKVIHFHHGGESDYRERAAQFTAMLCKQEGFEFELVKSTTDLKSEASMRLFRIKKAIEIKNKIKNPEAFLFTAHHSQDLMETRLIRMIRGAGPQGFKAISEVSGAWVRPFLTISPSEITNFVKLKSLAWVEDPSNQNINYLRNWIRKFWLPALDKKRPGGSLRLGSSLELIASELDSKGIDSRLKMTPMANGFKFPRKEYLLLNQNSQRQVLATVFFELKIQGYTQGQVHEVWRRFGQSQLILRWFQVGSLEWSADQTWLYARNPKLG